jgi:hypothetical protein
MHQQPGADAFVRAFGGRAYGAIAPRPVARNLIHGPGAGWSGEDVESLRLHYFVGRERHEIAIENSVFSRTALVTVQTLVVNLLLHSLWARRPLRRFPIDLRIERRKLSLPVDGKDHVFTVYTCDAVMKAVAEIGDFVVTIDGPVDVVPRVRLAAMDAGSLRRWLDPAARKTDRRHRKTLT